MVRKLYCKFHKKPERGGGGQKKKQKMIRVTKTGYTFHKEEKKLQLPTVTDK